MSTSLGWKDVGTVLYTKADALRQKGDLMRGDGSRDEPVFQGAVMSRRVHKSVRIDQDLERDKEQAAAFNMDKEEVYGKRPESRLKWLLKAMTFVGKKTLKVGDLYEIVTHKRFVVGASDKVGVQMKRLLLANAHLFSSKQQKFMQSEESSFGAFDASKAPEPLASSKRRKEASSSSSEEESPPPPPPKKSKKSGKSNKKRRKHSSSSAGEKNGSEDSAPVDPPPKRRQDIKVPVIPSSENDPRKDDPRLHARGAADDF
mmetsp:Transcript_20429/g.52240  ORF Transcript_20429/g.52240 Transcript_20429/m.52240 type:complete len:259 (+) Transcript_20429:74-850(+)|eukprot:CAMPEP_0183444434 /NCGR_PEP_ID=MMETSP0370-20130417/95032_1 /TAXON_ID=268820 /ORGANISM="Peridinium aciculiferum, Strain PAER-2" /LENGTH=258 /DNA_ID=CAMNT_0025634785 /DNA_START=62 /DNA_END=838 /DNA_ORIENTATION=+